MFEFNGIHANRNLLLVSLKQGTGEYLKPEKYIYLNAQASEIIE